MKILYICTHNRCRSILSEAVTNQLAGGVINAQSAGSQPAGVVHPLSVKYLEQAGYNTDGLQSQSWDEFESFAPDIVVTVCDSAAGESCPVWFGNSIKVHWGLSDPSKVVGSDKDIETAFNQCIALIEGRVKALITLAETAQSKGFDRDELRKALAQLGAQ
ncbi:arsenate reductase ArsC [Alteromonas gilva]|uniref:Arsenate reductase ArsC n=1 Tax=Alteromonas gilva TaxID=2987522 RepID=A0ABT5L065_9ALTE|nr:arsenate reductase ArsC [Alteromonas gilva]MDC8830282.1 arsenate reductase ArsC [Alteromonas gilva]